MVLDDKFYSLAQQFTENYLFNLKKKKKTKKRENIRLIDEEAVTYTCAYNQYTRRIK